MANASAALGGGVGVDQVLASGKGGPKPSDFTALGRKAEQVVSEEKSAVAEGEKALGRIDRWAMSEHDKANAARTAASESLPVAPKPVASPKYQPTDPMKAWGSAAMLVAMVGSALTRTPMNAALNAAAGALKAIHQNDLETFDIEFKRWQMETANAEKMYQYQMNGYQKQMAELDRQEGISTREAAGLRQSVKDSMTALAHAYGDQRMVTALQMKGLEGAEKVIQDERQWFRSLAEHQGQMAEQAEEYKAIQAFKASPEGQKLWDSGDYAGFMKKLVELNPKMGATMDRQFLNFTEKAVKDIQSSTTGKQYFVLKNADQAIRRAVEEIKSGAPSIDGVTSNTLIDIYARAVGGGVARRFLIENLQVHSTNLYQQGDQIEGKFDPKGGGMSSLQANNLVHAMLELKQQADKDYAGQVDSAAKLLESYGGDGAMLRERAGVDASRPTESSSRPEYHVALPWTQTPQQFTQAVGQFFPGHRVVVNPQGGYRPSSSGSSTSEHKGMSPLDRAYDFHVEGMSYPVAAMKTAANFLANNVPFDQVLIEGSHVHVGWGEKNRQSLAVKPQAGRTSVHPIEATEIEGAFHAGMINQQEYEVLMSHYGKG